MIATLIAWFGGIVGPKPARPLLIGLAMVLVVAMLGVGKCRYDAAIIQRHDTARNAEISAQGRAGEARAAEERRIDDARIRNETQEVTNATQSIPDRTVSDRQHARACIILRRQARPGDPIPAGC
ncbi:hypothetical protein [Sphingomonas alpina]|uniref:Uncharacterized protein n=1 Tax=Sphingomonas alpina TaxID=653931 RepID=A0A7H0LF24_9SPHN|nr:hypothetical protein [Sphingomonas alpina]QNQ08277.1 hypothetical protein H3Z74_16150 [Sphingomonas alpina]